ncbi:MAG: methyltransferase [Marinilabiliales bacterium]|nr:methyltransferase [Marinilabiliales bacterium]
MTPPCYAQSGLRRRREEKRSPVKIYASDISAEAVRMARLNIAAANLNDTVDISEGDFMTKPAPAEEGVLILNPPYGKRLGGEEMDKFYGEIGRHLNTITTDTGHGFCQET